MDALPTGTLATMLHERVRLFASIGAPCLLEKFVLRNATELQGVAKPRGVRAGRMRECFKNAADLALKRDGFEYYEGLALSASVPILPVRHAWCMKDGRVVDNTWPAAPGSLYMGVHVPRTTLVQQLVTNRVYGILDTGTGYNTDLMAALDPGFQAIVDAAINDFNQRMNSATPEE